MMRDMLLQVTHADGSTKIYTSAGVDHMPDMKKIEKPELERMQLDMYHKITKSHPELAFDLICQRERPDFIISRNGQEIGLDVAVLGDETRRSANACFERVLTIFSKIYADGGLRKCQNLMFQLRFPKSRKKIQVSGADKLSSAISELADRIGKLSVYDDIDPGLSCSKRRAKIQNLKRRSIPHCAGAGGVTSDGSIFWNVTGVMTVPRSNFERECGFGLDLNYSEGLTESEMAKRVQDVIDSHDKELDQGIDELVILVDAPGANGEIIRAEQYLANLYLMSGVRVNVPKYLKRVVLIFWGGTGLNILYPHPA